MKAPDRRGRRGGARLPRAAAIFVVNDDVEAALELGADGVHLGRDDDGAERALGAGLLLGRSASTRSTRRASARRRRPTSAPARSGRRRRSPTPTRRSASTGLARDLSRRRDPGGRDRRHRRLERGAPASRPAPPASRSIRAATDARRCGGRSMRLSELGELGLLAELERRGLARGDRERRRPARGRARRHAGRARRGRPLPARLDRAGATSASAPRRSTSATSPPRAPSRRRCSSRSARPARRRSTTCSSSTRACTSRACRCVGGDTTASEQLVLSVTALGRSERVPGRGGARPGDLLVVTGPLGAAGAAFRERRHVAPAAAPRGRPPPRRSRRTR